MAKKKQHIDEFFKERLAGSELPLDGTEWSKLAGVLQEKKKRRIFWWWLLLIPGFLLGYYLFNSNNAEQAAGASSRIEPVAATTPEALPNASKSDSKEQSELKQGQAEEQPLKDSPSAPTGEIQETANSQEGVINYPPSSSPITPATVELSEPMASRLIEDNQPIISDQMGSIALRRWSTSLADGQGYFNLLSKSISAIPYLRSLDSISKTKQVNLTRPKKKSQKMPLEIGLTYSPSINAQSLKGPTDASESIRNHNEQNDLGHRIAIQVNTTYKNWQLGSGIAYEVRNQQLNSPQEIKYQLYDSIAFVDLNLDTTWLPWNYRDTSVTGDFNAPKYQMVSIPIRVGKEFPISTRLSLLVQGELGLNILLSATGDAALWENSINKIDKNQLRTLTVSAGIHAGVRYRLLDQWAIQLDLAANQDLSNMSNLSGTRQRFTSYGGQVGLFYTLQR